MSGDRLKRWADKQDPEPMSPRWSPITSFLPPPQAALNPEAILRGELTFLNQTHDVGSPPKWDTTDPPKLWQYNLHYMDYLWALPADDARALVLDYIEQHTPLAGHCGWEPYPLSLRLMNWCALLYGRDREETLADEAGHATISATIRLMAGWLSRNLETHIRANHLLENDLALAFVGGCFHPTDKEIEAGGQDDEIHGWWTLGYEGVKYELGEQVLADGGHYERSPMYQSRLLCGLLWLLNQPIDKDDLLDDLKFYPQRMANHLAAMTHPDGQIALFNDAAFGVYNTPEELFDFAERIGIRVDRAASNTTHWLAESGYAVGGSGADTGDHSGGDSEGDSGTGHRFIMDVGELAPSYQPGHAHSDLLSFELSLFGKRLIVDAGNYDYIPSEMRRYCRGVKAHNTLEINGQDQCELWSAFRVGRRASPVDVHVQVQQGGEPMTVQASHNGYDHLPGRPRHTRTAKWYAQGVLLVEDRVESTEEVQVVSRLRLAEGWALRTVNLDHYELAHGQDIATIKLMGENGWQIEEGWTCPGFYEKRPCRVLTHRTRGRSVRSGFCIVAGRPTGITPFEKVQLNGQTFDW